MVEKQYKSNQIFAYFASNTYVDQFVLLDTFLLHISLNYLTSFFFFQKRTFSASAFRKIFISYLISVQGI